MELMMYDETKNESVIEKMSCFTLFLGNNFAHIKGNAKVHTVQLRFIRVCLSSINHSFRISCRDKNIHIIHLK